jgi:hypothetical protein
VEVGISVDVLEGLRRNTKRCEQYDCPGRPTAKKDEIDELGKRAPVTAGG